VVGREEEETNDVGLVNIRVFHSIPFPKYSVFQGCTLVFDKVPSLGQMEVIFHPACPRVPALVIAVIAACSSTTVFSACFCRTAEPNCFLLQELWRWDLLCGAMLHVSANYRGCFAPTSEIVQRDHVYRGHSSAAVRWWLPLSPLPGCL